MIRSILFVILIGLLGLAIIVLIAINAQGNNKKNYVNVGSNKSLLTKVSGALAGISVVALLLVPNSFHQVEVGQVAVVKSLGKVVGTRMPGTYFDFYLVNDYIYFDTTIQRLEVDSESYSSDAQTMDILMTVQYKIDPL